MNKVSIRRRVCQRKRARAEVLRPTTLYATDLGRGRSRALAKPTADRIWQCLAERPASLLSVARLRRSTGRPCIANPCQATGTSLQCLAKDARSLTGPDHHDRPVAWQGHDGDRPRQAVVPAGHHRTSSRQRAYHIYSCLTASDKHSACNQLLLSRCLCSIGGRANNASTWCAMP